MPFWHACHNGRLVSWWQTPFDWPRNSGCIVLLSELCCQPAAKEATGRTYQPASRTSTYEPFKSIVAVLLLFSSVFGFWRYLASYMSLPTSLAVICGVFWSSAVETLRSKHAVGCLYGESSSHATQQVKGGPVLMCWTLMESKEALTIMKQLDFGHCCFCAQIKAFDRAVKNHHCRAVFILKQGSNFLWS